MEEVTVLRVTTGKQLGSQLRGSLSVYGTRGCLQSASGLTVTGILLLSMVVPMHAQRIGAVRGWATAPDCVSKASTQSPDKAVATDDVHDEKANFAQRARDIVQGLPQDGNAQKLAQHLLRLLDGTLRFACKDELTGEYIVRYPIGLGTEFVSDSEFDEFRFALSNLSHPMVEFNVGYRPASEEYIYTYSLYNGKSAMRPIRMWYLVTPINDDSLELAHSIWYSHPTEVLIDLPAVAPQAALYWDIEGPELRRISPLGRWAMWSSRGHDQEIQPEKQLDSFVAKSQFRPGWTTAFVAGGEYMSIPWREDGIPEQVRNELGGILQRAENTFSAVPVIGPMFRADHSASAVARNWIQGVRVLIEFGYVSEQSSFVKELLEVLELVQVSEDSKQPIVESAPSNEYEVLLIETVEMAFGSSD